MPSRLNLLRYSACSESMFPPACAADWFLACSIGGAWRKQDSRCCVRFCCPSRYWITEIIAMNWADQTEKKLSATENGRVHVPGAWDSTPPCSLDYRLGRHCSTPATSTTAYCCPSCCTVWTTRGIRCSDRQERAPRSKNFCATPTLISQRSSRPCANTGCRSATHALADYCLRGCSYRLPLNTNVPTARDTCAEPCSRAVPCSARLGGYGGWRHGLEISRSA